MTQHPTRWFPAASILFICLWLGLLAVGRDRMLRDPGTLWHTVVGEKILTTGHVIRHDPFSFSQKNQEWISQQWLGECAMALIHRVSGLDGLVMFTAALLAGMFTLIAVRLNRSGLPWLPTCLFIGLTIAASSYHFIPRPHLATIGFFLFMLTLLNDVEAGRKRLAWLFALIPLFIVWTNIHGGALGGIATLVIVAIGWIVWPKALQGANCHSQAKRVPLLGIILCLDAAALLVNPYGTSLPTAWLSLMKSDVLPKIIIEHAPLQFTSIEGFFILLLAAIYFFVLAGAWRAGTRMTWLMPAIWFVLAISRVRHGPLFAVAAAIAIADMLPHTKLFNRLREFMQSTSGTTTTSYAASARGGLPHGFIHQLRPAAIPTLLISVSLTLQAAHIPCPLIGAGWARLNPKYWPVESTEALRAQMEELPEGARVFNEMRFGGYLIYALPDARIYIDDRCDLYGDAGLRRYIELRKHPERIGGVCEYENVDAALIAARSPMTKYFDHASEWQILHQDSTARLYARRMPLRAAMSSP